MRYFLWVYVEKDGTETPKSAHRASADWTTLERFDPKTRMWVDNPGLLSATGIGGDNNYREVDRADVVRFLSDQSVGI